MIERPDPFWVDLTLSGSIEPIIDKIGRGASDGFAGPAAKTVITKGGGEARFQLAAELSR